MREYGKSVMDEEGIVRVRRRTKILRVVRNSG